MPIEIWSWNQRKTNAYEVSFNGVWLRRVCGMVLWPGYFKGFGFVTWNVTDENGCVKYDCKKEDIVTKTRFGFIRIQTKEERWPMVYMPQES